MKHVQGYEVCRPLLREVRTLLVSSGFTGSLAFEPLLPTFVFHHPTTHIEPNLRPQKLNAATGRDGDCKPRIEASGRALKIIEAHGSPLQFNLVAWPH